MLAPMGLRLSEEKTTICHIDQGFDFLGYRIQRRRSEANRSATSTPTRRRRPWPPSSTRCGRLLGGRHTNPSLEVLLHRLNPVLRGWTNYFRYGVSSKTFNYLRAFVWRRVVRWLRGKHPRLNWKQLRRRYLSGWWPTEGRSTLFNPAAGRRSSLPLPGQTPSPLPGPDRRKGPPHRPAT